MEATGNDDDGNDNDGISLDNQLQCCACVKGKCSDDNDLLLCDGKGCYRAYHMQCAHPHVRARKSCITTMPTGYVRSARP